MTENEKEFSVESNNYIIKSSDYGTHFNILEKEGSSIYPDYEELNFLIVALTKIRHWRYSNDS